MSAEWHPFANGGTLGTKGSEDGVILRDEEHTRGARITLERETKSAPFAITCGIYGSMFHTTFVGTEVEAVAKYDEMKVWLHEMLTDELTQEAYTTRLQEFVDRF